MREEKDKKTEKFLAPYSKVDQLLAILIILQGSFSPIIQEIALIEWGETKYKKRIEYG